MKIVLLTSDYHITANIGVKAFLDNPGLKKHGIEVAGIVVADQFSFGKKHLKRTAYYFRKMHFMFLLKNIVTNIWKQMKIFAGRHLFARRKREYFALNELGEKHNVPVFEVESINSAGARNFIRSQHPDMLVSCFLLEILQQDVLDIPPKGSINVHPSLIQKHRGAFSAFWTIARNWKKGGATVHYMTDKVDEGDVVLQKHFFVYPSDTIHSINSRAAKLGGKLLVKALINIKKKRARRYKLKTMAKIFTIPNNKEISAFYAKGRSLISTKEFFTL